MLFGGILMGKVVAEAESLSHLLRAMSREEKICPIGYEPCLMGYYYARIEDNPFSIMIVFHAFLYLSEG